MSLFADKIIEPDCPNCGAKNLKHVDNWNTDRSLFEYYAKIEVVGRFQLVRMFRVEKYMKRKQPVQFRHVEAMQHFIREDGKMESLQRLGQGMGSIYVDSWVYGSHLELRTKSHSYYRRNAIAPYKIIPGRETLPIIRRNGYKGYFYGEAPHQFFTSILRYPKAETLLKAGQKSLFKYMCGLSGVDSRYDRIEKYWPSICIAIRNDYIVGDAGDWLDYLSMLERLDKDLNNAHYVCPDDLHREHNRYNEKIAEINRQRSLEEMKQKILEENPKYIESKKPFFGLQFSAGDIEIVPLKSVEEYLIEGDKLHHCLFNNGYYKKEDCLHLSARLDGEPVETIEVNLEQLKVTQARGLQNKATDHHETIVEAVRKNMGKIASIASKHNIADFESAMERREAAA